MIEQKIDPTHSFVVEDAIKYGSIEKALLVKEIRGMQVYKLRNSGQGWVYYSSAALEKKFPYMKKESIKRWLGELVDDGTLETTIQNKIKFDKTKSYRLPEISLVGQNEPSWVKMNHRQVKMNRQTGQNEPTIPPHSSQSTPLSRNSEKKEKRGVESPAKERIRLAREAGDWSLLKEMS